MNESACRVNCALRLPFANSRHYALVALALMLLAATSHHAAAGDAANGGLIAKRWCTACHVASTEQKRSDVAAPSFASIARKRQRPERLTAFLSAPHPTMPDMALSRSEIADIVAYIGSLRH